MRFYRNIILAMRPWSFTMSVFSVSLAAVVAADDGPFSWPLYLITLIGMVALHAAGNLTNDYFDVKSGLDTAATATYIYRPHPLAEGAISPGLVMLQIVVLYALAAGIGLYLASVSGWPVLVIGLLGVLGGFGYTAPPLKYKHHALGEACVFLMWGPLAVEGAYYVQRGRFSLEALLVSLPLGVLVALVLLANNLRDLETDSRSGVRTLAGTLGFPAGRRLFVGLVALAYLAVTLMSVLGPLSPWSLAVLISLPVAIKLLREVIVEPPADADARTAQLVTAFGGLLIASMAVSHFL